MFIIQEYNLIKSVLSIGSNFIKPMIEKWHLNHQVDDCLINFDIVLDKYFERSAKKCSLLNTVVQNIEKKPLKNIYFPLTLEPMFSSANDDIIKLDEYNKERLEKYNNILIIDNAGMGKSTLMKFLFLDVLEKKHIGIPFFIELRLLPTDKSIIDYLFEEIEDIKDATSSKVKKEFLKSMIEYGDCIFFFDGYDEVSPDNKAIINQKLQDFINKAHKNKYFISSRPDESLSIFYNEFYQFKIKPLSKEEAYTLLTKFDNNGAISKDLITQLEKDDKFKRLHEFLSNPLMVSLLYFNYKRIPILPGDKCRFYNNVYENLYEEHDLRKGGKFNHAKYSGLDLVDFERILYYIGFYSTFKLQKTIYTKDELLSLIDDASVHYNNSLKPLHSDFKSIDYLNDLLKTVPLFTKIDIYYSWIHNSFQEYFSAHFIKNLSSKEKIISIVFKYKNIGTYYNLLDFYYQIDPEPINNIIIKPFLKEFLTYMDSTKITDENYLLVKALLFSQNITLKHSKTKAFNPFNEQLVRLATILETYTDHSYDVRYQLYPNINIHTEHNISWELQTFLKNHNIDLWKEIQFGENYNDRNELNNISNDSLKSFLNPEYNLNKIIDDYDKIKPFIPFLIKVYIKNICQQFNKPIFILDYNKCKQALKQINQEIEEANNLSWLDSI